MATIRRLMSSSVCHKTAALCIVLVISMQHLTSTIALSDVEYRGNETDYTALLAIKSQLVDRPTGVFSSWNHSLHHCYWEGVICGHNDRVTVLDLSSKGLVGTISPFIGNLSFLTKIALHGNSLHGEIPPEIGRLFKLQVLDISENTLSGEIPANFSRCINLKEVILATNKLHGNFPPGLRALSNLKRLSIHSNNITGALFKVISNLTSLEVISCAYNSFTGTIPHSISRIRNLRVLYLAMNKLSGALPESIFNLTSLQNLQLSFNQFQGSIPQNVGVTLPNLKFFSIAQNNFSGIIPDSISNLTSLRGLDLSHNSFIGNITFDFSRVQNLLRLGLADNSLEGDINFISSLVNCSNLRLLNLQNNWFTGILPTTVANLSTNLKWLLVGQNPIRGDIPKEISKLSNLAHLILDGSEVTGTIPQDLGKLQFLEDIFLSSNRLTGKIPTSLGNLSHLSFLYLEDNYLEGAIPPSLGSCANLLFLQLSYNYLNETLPRDLFGGTAKFLEIDLSVNQLEGPIPAEISKQTNLLQFIAYENKLSGHIPVGFGDLPTLQYLYLSNNSLQGSLPLSFKSLLSLSALDLSVNNLSGPLPSFISSLPLMYLNLSYNDFDGRVPTKGVFANESALDLQGNNKLCGGISELDLPRCAEKESKQKKRSRFIMWIILVICSFVAVTGMVTCIWLYLIFLRRKTEFSQSSSVEKELFLKVSYDKLLKATDGFSLGNLLGSGTFGSVYRGDFEGKTVAVKVLNLQHQGGSKSFIAECEALRNIRHRNLVPIITVCSSIDFQGNDFKALVYEFMPNGSLEKCLYEDRTLSLLQRVNIAIDIGQALNYLHHECGKSIVHCDLKPSNVLLGNDMIAHLADFGLAKVLAQPLHPNQSSSIGATGTIGYIAPEYGLGREASTEADIYSYGILLLELMTGKRPTDDMFIEDFSLHMYVKAALHDNVLQIVDSTLLENQSLEGEAEGSRTQETRQKIAECLNSVLNIGVASSKQSPQDRMKITTAISELQQARSMLLNLNRQTSKTCLEENDE